MRQTFPPKPCRTLVAGMVLALTCLPLGQEMTAQAEEAQQQEDEYHPELELGVHGGGHFFSSTNALGRDPATEDNILRHSGAVGARLGLGLTRHWVPEIEFLVIPTQTMSERTRVTVLAWRAHVLFNFLTGRVKPFVLGGVGALSSFSNNQQEVRDSTDPLFHAGAGLKIDFTKNVGMRLDGRILLPTDVQRLMGPDYEALLGFYGRFTLGKPAPPPDTDGDGVIDKEDQCPREVGVKENKGCPDKDSDGDTIVDRLDRCPDKAGVKELQGCPEPDADNDGVIDREDQCPNEAGVKENRGCPDKDSDGDGVVDRLDKCVDKPGVKELEGCPEPDADNDGIVDRLDKCADKPETKNGYEDEDGCPDEVPKAVKRFTGVIQGINFETGKAVILKNSFPLLDRAVKVLKDYESVKMEIQGHTDNVGAHDYNMDLSQKRADAVKAYFVEKGVSADRLKATGFGPDKPIADNKTPAGRTKNRRVEFQLGTGAEAPAAPAQAPAPATQAPAPATQAAPAAPAAPAPAPAAPETNGKTK